MANGATVRLPLPESPSSVGCVKADQSAAPAASQGNEIGEAVADATTMLCKAILGHRETGVLDPEVKDASAGRIARVAMLQLDHESGDDDFICKARSAGSARLRQYFDDDFFWHHSPAEADTAISICINEARAFSTSLHSKNWRCVTTSSTSSLSSDLTHKAMDPSFEILSTRCSVNCSPLRNGDNVFPAPQRDGEDASY